MSFALYGTPTPDTPFSAESFRDITIADADRIIHGGQLPHILPKSSLRAWVFDREVPTSLKELTLSANELVCRIKGRGDDMIMCCKGDPRVPQFYHHCYALGVVTAKLKSRGKEKKGLATNTLAVVKRQVAKVQVNMPLTVEKENARDLEISRKRKKRHSADRDLVAVGLSLSPRKCRKLD